MAEMQLDGMVWPLPVVVHGWTPAVAELAYARRLTEFGFECKVGGLCRR